MILWKTEMMIGVSGTFHADVIIYLFIFTLRNSIKSVNHVEAGPISLFPSWKSPPSLSLISVKALLLDSLKEILRKPTKKIN